MSRELYQRILSQRTFAVTGASQNTAKFGYKIYRFMKNAGYEVYPVNPNADEVEGDKCYPTLADLPTKPDCVIMVTPAPVTEATAREAGTLGISYLWIQPGAESQEAIRLARETGAEVVAGGPCIMVEYNLRQR